MPLKWWEIETACVFGKLISVSEIRYHSFGSNTNVCIYFITPSIDTMLRESYIQFDGKMNQNVLSIQFLKFWKIFFILQKQIKLKTFRDIPWYHLSPRQRKHYLFFLCQLQDPTVFKAFKIFPINLESFPLIMNTVYNCLNLVPEIIRKYSRWQIVN